MTFIFFRKVVLSALFLVASPALALTVDYGGASYDIDTDGEDNVQVETYINGQKTNTSVTNTGGTLNVDTNVGGQKTNVNLQNTGGTLKVQTNVNGQKTDVGLTGGNNSGSINVMIDGKPVNVEMSEGSLNVQVDKGLSASGQDTVVSLEGNTDLLIKTEDDLQAYNELVIRKRPAVKQIKVNDSSLEVEYGQPAKFLGFVSTKLNAKVAVTNGGRVQVKLPWYSFLFTKNTAEVSSNIESSLRVAGNNNNVDLNLIGRNGNTGSIGASTDGEGNSSVTFRNNAHTLNVVTSVIDGKVGVGLSGN